MNESLQQAERYAEACLNKAMMLCEEGRFRAALQGLRHALRLGSSLQREIYSAIASILSQLAPEDYRPELEEDLRLCYSQAHIDHQKLSHITANQLLHKHKFYAGDFPSGQGLRKVIEEIACDKLWLDFLSKVINTSPRMEFLLCAVRRTLLFDLHDKSGLPEDRIALIAAIGLQCFANEYILAASEDESRILEQLFDSINKAVNLKSLVNLLLLSAMYRPLMELDDLGALTSANLFHNPYVIELFENTVSELRLEHELRSSIKLLLPEQDLTSKKVRSQYEENPYPRWKAPPSYKKISMGSMLRRLPGFKPQAFLNGKIDVLVAGCGTGFEAIEIASMDDSLKVTAVDLSVSSLAYAARMAEKLDVSNVEFLQGDILDLARLDSKFGLVVSTGVLHHMAEPETGWRRLCEVTQPGGVMRISLYSERARRRIVRAREQIARLGLTSSPEHIRMFRAEIFNAEPGSEFAEIAESDDFYSMSGCRDLLFHVQEHRFNLRQIAVLLSDLELELIGMGLPSPEMHVEFLKMFPGESTLNDLYKWDQLEERFPDTFLGMYQLWCQKV